MITTTIVNKNQIEDEKRSAEELFELRIILKEKHNEIEKADEVSEADVNEYNELVKQTRAITIRFRLYYEESRALNSIFMPVCRRSDKDKFVNKIYAVLKGKSISN